MRIRNRSLSSSAVSTPLTRDLPATPATKQEEEEEEKEPKPEKERKVHLNRDFSDKNQLHRSCDSVRPPQKDLSPSRQYQPRQINGWISQHGCRNLTEGSSCMLPKQEEDWATAEEGEGEETWSANHDRSNKLGAQTTRLLLPSQAGARSEGESSYPLKKRKRNYEFMLMGSFDMTKKKKTKHTVEDSNDYHNDINNRVHNVEKVSNDNNSKNNTGNVLEGSRCSRVNGRGWRCSQATLVGYSLCEHHLGKGRLKSINSNNTLSHSFSSTSISKGNSLWKPNKKLLSEQQGQQQEDDDDDGGGGGEEEEKKKKKKKKAGGFVKARSINSLLGQLHQTAPNMLS